ncbi:GntR family transcriptional regulator [Citricoccus sp. NPDC055426]|uniref:GntR family transcriptional regulator n=1 Tax=Citricoccus sp. NPDC055426 TaxID=3155536 RepID=UPI003432D268
MKTAMSSQVIEGSGRGGSRVELVYSSLRGEIISGRYAPGTPLRTAALAKEHDVSLSVVRESLVRLAESGLAESNPNQGFRVVSISRADLLDLNGVRILLETEVLRRSIDTGDISWEAEVVSTHHVLDSIPVQGANGEASSAEWAEAHARFHDALGTGCGSPRLISMVRTMRDSAEIYRQLSGPRGQESGRDIRGEHRTIMELSTGRDSDGATAALAQHLQRTTDLLLSEVLTEDSV